VVKIFFAGIDLGSTMTKIVIINEEEKVIVSTVRHTGAEHRRLASQVMKEGLETAGITLNDIAYIVATGYGRINVPFADHHYTELTCHARGVSRLFPGVRLAIDIGGQDSKGLQIKDGKLIDFVMNDKCAAGTGRFLEVFAKILGLKIEDLGELSSKTLNRVPINSPCTVFIQQEVANYLTQGVLIEEIVAGLHYAIAGKVTKMVKKLKIEPDVVFTGGVAKNKGVIKALEEQLGCRVLIPEEPLLTGAFGAAILAQETTLKALSAGKSPLKGERRLIESKLFT
jgi:(R)-2-hydroxyacyl-CoA dehydratese activating ATPase